MDTAVKIEATGFLQLYRPEGTIFKGIIILILAQSNPLSNGKRQGLAR